MSYACPWADGELGGKPLSVSALECESKCKFQLFRICGTDEPSFHCFGSEKMLLFSVIQGGSP